MKEFKVLRNDGSVFTTFPTELLAQLAAESWNTILDREHINRHYEAEDA